MRVAARLLFLFALCTLAVAACDSGGPEPPSEPPCTAPLVPSSDDPLTPLAVGKSWTYKSTYYLRPTPRTDTLKAQVTDKARICHEGRAYQAAIWSWVDPLTEEPFFPQWLRWNGTHGQYMIGGIFEADTFKTHFLQRKYPTESGAEYDVPRLVYHKAQQQFLFADTLTHRVDTTQAEFTTPAGTFTAYVFYQKRHPAPDVADLWHYKAYYAPGIGPVGRVVRENDGDLVSRRVLTEYDISDAPNEP